MSQSNPHFLQQRKILIDNLLHMRTQQETEHQIQQPHHSIRQVPMSSGHSLHNTSGVNNSSNLHNTSSSHHTSNMHGNYMMDPRHYGNSGNMVAYPTGNMVHPVNLMGNVPMGNRQVSAVMDLHRVPPKPMPPQSVHEQHATNMTHQVQQMHQMVESVSSVGNRQLHETQHQTHHEHQPQQQHQHPVHHSQMSLQSPQHQQHHKDLNPLKNSAEATTPQPNEHANIPDKHREEDQQAESFQELVNVKKEVMESEDINPMDVVSIISATDVEKEKEGEEDDEVTGDKLVIEEMYEEYSDDECENDENQSGTKGKKPFKCSVCPKQFARKNWLINHLKKTGHEDKNWATDVKEEAGEFACDLCEKTFVDNFHLKRHVKTHSEKVYTCTHCNIEYSVKREYNRHMKIHDGVKTLLCSVCSKTFTDRVKFNRHMRAHEGIKPFQCNVCGESFTQRSNLNIHLRIHDGIRPFQCNVCYICFTNKSDLNRHSRIHNGIKPFLCSMCAKCFSRKDDLNRHMKIHEGSKRYLCTMCPKCFTRKDDLNRHMRNHDGLKPFQCTVCFESFTQKALLNIHLRIHTNSKPHECSLCTETFSQKSNLYIHLKLQHGVNPFKCEQCPNETFEKETQLSLHMRTVHGDKPFKCSMCDEGFARKSILKEHLRASHNVNPFKCDICFKCFTKKSNLRTHIKTHEPIQCDKCPEIFEHKTELQEHIDKCHSLDDVEEDDDDEEASQISVNCSKCLKLVRISREIKTEVPFVCPACTGQKSKKKSSRSSKEAAATKEGKKKRVKDRPRKGKGKTEFACELCSKTFQYKRPLVKHCKSMHNVELTDSENEESKKAVESIKVEKETTVEEGISPTMAAIDSELFSGPLGEFKCAVCEKVFVRKATLDRHVTIHGITSGDHDAIMGNEGEMKQADETHSQHGHDASGEDMNIPDINIKESDTDNVYIVTPKIEEGHLVKEELASDYEDNDVSMADMHDDSVDEADVTRESEVDDDDDLPLAKRVSSGMASSADEGRTIVEETGPKKRGRKKGVPNRKKIVKSEVETTDNDESAVDTDYVGYDSRAEESGVEGKENEEGGEKRKKGRRIKSEKQTDFPCPQCGKVFNRRTTMNRHIRIHTGIKEFQCWICSKCFMEKSHLNRHLKKHYGVGIPEPVEVDAPYCCSICERKFTIKGQLSRHLKAHETEKPESPQTCEICDKSFDKTSKFKRHMKVHDGVREHQCQVCGNRFKQKSNLNIHMKIHEGIKAHECHVCMMKFTNKSDLNRHMRKHDGVKPFLCSICAKSFSRKDDLNRHMRKHDGIKPFLCSMCAEAFARKDHLKKHMRKCYGPPIPGEVRSRKRARKTQSSLPLAPPVDVAAAMVATQLNHNGLTQDLSMRPAEPPQYRSQGGVANGSVAAHAHQVLQASVGQAAASGLFWCAAQYYTNPPTIEFGHKPEYYSGA
uniref:Zinc finger protein 268 n=1 Tax=Cacopsylla melanoneura TaxID=428564 RepID=A0A8D9EDI4_9HEMI